MSHIAKITKEAVTKLAEGDYIRDSDIKGFTAVKNRDGTVTFKFQYRHRADRKEYKPRIGAYPSVSVEFARQTARQWAGLVATGQHPVVRAEPLPEPAPVQSNSVRDLGDLWLDVYCPSNKCKSSISQDRAMLEKHIYPRFGELAVTSLRRLDIQQFHDSAVTKPVRVLNSRSGEVEVKQVLAPVAANRTVVLLKSMLNWANLLDEDDTTPRWGLDGKNPARKIVMFDERERHYPFSDEETDAIADKLTEYELTRRFDIKYIQAIRLIALLGVRKEQVIELRYPNIRGEQIVWGDTKTTKSGSGDYEYRDITAPVRAILTAMEAERVEGNDHVFPLGKDGHIWGVKHVWDALIEDCNLRKLIVEYDPDKPTVARVHDLRHFFGDVSHDAGLSERKIMRLMGHKSSITSARYAKGSNKARRSDAEVVQLEVARRFKLVPSEPELKAAG